MKAHTVSESCSRNWSMFNVRKFDRTKSMSIFYRFHHLWLVTHQVIIVLRKYSMEHEENLYPKNFSYSLALHGKCSPTYIACVSTFLEKISPENKIFVCTKMEFLIKLNICTHFLMDCWWSMMCAMTSV